MTCWHEHNPDTWIIENPQRHVVALVCWQANTNLYQAQKGTQNLGLYATLQAAMQAATPPNIALHKHQHFPQKSAKTTQDLPWDT